MKHGDYTILLGDCREKLSELPAGHFHCCVTSPPYFGLRDYGVDGQIGLEPTPDDFIAAMLEVGRGLWRVLRDDATWFLNIGDSYANSGKGGNPEHSAFQKQKTNRGTLLAADAGKHAKNCYGLKPKDLMMIPARVALALQAAGWYLRDDIIWWKPAPMPGSQRDRCTSSYEHIFQLTKKPTYFFDMEAIKEPCEVGYNGSTFTNGKTGAVHDNIGQGPRFGGSKAAGYGNPTYSGNEYSPLTHRTPRNVWRIASDGGFDGEHYATFPLELPTRCIKAGTSEKGCCENCGAPYKRITEREQLKRERPNELTKRTGENGTGNHCANTVAGVEVRTIGWDATCKCEAGIVPCRVIEPFAGAGTTLLAAAQLGRDSVGIELNEKYAAMARRRIESELRPSTFRDESKIVDSPLFAESP